MAVDLNALRNLVETARAKADQHKKPNTGRSWYNIKNRYEDNVDEIHLYDSIGEWGITAADFVRDLKSLTSNSLELHINCEGGEVFDGLAIYETLRQSNKDITVHIDGLAASAASFIAMAGDKIIMARNARMMIHNAHGLVMGNADDMREMANLLDDLSSNIADIYAERTGGTVKQWLKAMKGPNAASDGTWYNAEEAVKAGLADEVAGTPSKEKTENTVNNVLAEADIDFDFIRNALMEAFQ